MKRFTKETKGIGYINIVSDPLCGDQDGLKHLELGLVDILELIDEEFLGLGQEASTLRTEEGVVGVVGKGLLPDFDGADEEGLYDGFEEGLILNYY